ncbi:TetR/AcrR family transcriptional regulator [Aquabacterium sp.]|uniref:TetR/AcrR family transcriptional regulator n=1 Tax=Aquabacterium sp. TaxID=1872578 RepID=UPI003D6CFDC7
MSPSKSKAEIEEAPAKRAKRDPAKTRASILKAAVAEFAAKGYSGARTDQIAKRAKSNIRMLYHYFGGKDALYVCVLEEVLAKLRAEELQLDFTDTEPLEGVLQMFDFIDHHFAKHPELRNLLAFENLNRALHLKRSARIPEMATPVLGLLGKLVQRGEADGVFRPGVDPLQLYITMVSLAYYSKSHGYTLSRIFETDLLSPAWQQRQHAHTRQLLTAFLTASTVKAPSSNATRKTKP